MVAIPEKLVFMDVETTGLDPKDDRIIEVYLLALSRSGEVSEYETLLNPGRPIPERITELTGLTDAAVAAAPREEEVAPRIRDFIGNGTPVAHNLPFDRRFFNAMFQRNNLTELSAAGMDTLVLSRELFPRLCIFPEGGGSHRLSNLMYFFGLEDSYANAHRAKEDVLLLVEVFRRLQDYALGRFEGNYPAAMTHGCPTCGSAMYLQEEGSERILICKKQPACTVRLVV